MQGQAASVTVRQKCFSSSNDKSDKKIQKTEKMRLAQTYNTYFMIFFVRPKPKALLAIGKVPGAFTLEMYEFTEGKLGATVASAAVTLQNRALWPYTMSQRSENWGSIS